MPRGVRSQRRGHFRKVTTQKKDSRGKTPASIRTPLNVGAHLAADNKNWNNVQGCERTSTMIWTLESQMVFQGRVPSQKGPASGGNSLARINEELGG